MTIVRDNSQLALTSLSLESAQSRHVFHDKQEKIMPCAWLIESSFLLPLASIYKVNPVPHHLFHMMSSTAERWPDLLNWTHTSETRFSLHQVCRGPFVYHKMSQRAPEHMNVCISHILNAVLTKCLPAPYIDYKRRTEGSVHFYI